MICKCTLKEKYSKLYEKIMFILKEIFSNLINILNWDKKLMELNRFGLVSKCEDLLCFSVFKISNYEMSQCTKNTSI